MTTTAILATPPNTMNMNRSTSPATSRDTGEHDASPPHQRLSPDTGDGLGGKGRALSTSKRAEQNRRAQRAFRERRDARVKHLEARAALLDETIAQTEEANRRWEECRALVDQLRHENAMLRTALENAGISTENIPSVHTNGHAPAGRGRSDDGMGDDFVPSRINGDLMDDSPSKKRKRVDDDGIVSRIQA
ncbi:hypothetical protein CPB86DRAFT_871860 [Serendipita vermifera]|nr:hypothetical protein CPB86DRAFT_871860 [Serendipita vermifera]